MLLGVTRSESGEVVAENQFITFIIGAGGFGGKKTSDKLKVSCVCVILFVCFCCCFVCLFLPPRGSS